ANEVWRGKGKKLDLFTRGNTPPREYLLTAMGQASALSIKIEESLKTEHPDGYAVDIQGAYEFITDIAPALEEVGFGVFLPGWWSKKGSKSRLRAKAKVKSPQLMQNGAGFSLDAVLEFNWEVALGESQLSLEDLRALAALKSPLVRVRGQWVELRSDEIQAAIAFLENPGGTASAREIIRMALGEGTAPGGLPIDGVSATGWMGELLDEMSRGDEMRELEPPKGFVGQLRPYQSRGYAWLAFLRKYGLGACLADDMGLGKTVQTLAMLQRDREEGESRPVLLVCPTSVVGNWLKEAARFTPSLKVLVHHGVTRERGESFQQQAEEYSLIITSYALLHRDYDVFKKIKWAGVILDEAQNIKNPSTKQARSARGLKADYRLALTGTPVENHVGELWSIMEFLNPGFLGTASEFHEKFFVPLQAERDQEAANRLKRLTGPFVLRRLKTDKSIIQDLPEKLEMKIYCSLTKEQASLYKSVVDQATAELEEADGIKRSGVILSTLMKLKQICNHPVHFLGDNTSLPDRSGKLDRLTEMIEEIYGVDDCALIFTQFTEMGNHLKRHLQETFGYEVIFLHGGVNKNNRDKMVERFQEEGGPRIFILSLKAGGTGLNLTRANHVFHYDRWWNPAVENQATDRAFRIGQTRAVQVHKFLCAGTLEDKIDELIDKKRDIADSVVGVGESWLTKLSTDELRDLFALREDAVSE
ncbi:MAG: DEAD/DEAH box helicase, partial [bacterium]